VPAARREVRFLVDCRYRGQAYEIVTPWPQLTIVLKVDAAAIENLLAEFHGLHLTRYAHSAPDEPVEIVTIRAVAIGALAKTPEAQRSDSDPPTSTPARKRKINTRSGWQETPVVFRSAIGEVPHPGPLLIEEDYSALLIEQGWTIARIDDGSLLATRQTETRS